MTRAARPYGHRHDFDGTATFLTMLSGVTALAWILVLAAWAWRLPRR